jgi:hypothetical protein
MGQDSQNRDQQAAGDRRRAAPGSPWAQRYGAKHRWQRLVDFPPGLRAPVKVRIYYRNSYFVLQWWDPGAKRNLAERVDGDLLAALIAARTIDERLTARRTAGVGHRRLGHGELVRAYLEDLGKRADAGSVSPASVRRFTSALQHYLDFAAQPAVVGDYPYALNINRDFRLAFDAYLVGKPIHANGHPQAPLRPMKGQTFIAGAVRAMLEWAADPERGALLPDTFRNPFRRPQPAGEVFKGDPLAEPEITRPMAVAFIETCDLYQLRLFGPLILFGLRAAEPCLLFRAHLETDWLRVCCIPELGYFTKGRRDKRLPLIAELRSFWDWLRDTAAPGLLYQRRSVLGGREPARLREASLADLIRELQERCAASQECSSAERLRLREQILREAGGLTYDHVEQEFQGVARRLRWPRAATLKDFRHAFATMLGNTPMAEAYKKYLMGQSPGKAALNAYTHLTLLREQFQAAVNSAWPALIAAIRRRVQEV